jgi:hypothetical protein
MATHNVVHPGVFAARRRIRANNQAIVGSRSEARTTRILVRMTNDLAVIGPTANTDADHVESVVGVPGKIVQCSPHLPEVREHAPELPVVTLRRDPAGRG